MDVVTEVNDNSVPQNSSTITVAHSVWKYINSPIIAIFSDLENPPTEQMLCSLLESLLKRSSTLTTVLIPPFSNAVTDIDLQQQYAAFTTWLFGTMFYLICKPSSNVILSNSIEVQACMLRILSRHHMTMFETITLEYLSILDEISEFYKDAAEEIILSKFCTEKDIIQNLDLTPFPAKIKSSDVPSIQESLLKIIMKTGASVWDKTKLWNRIITILVNSSPNLKIEALQLLVEIMEKCIITDHECTIIIMYSLEIVKNLPSWINLETLPAYKLLQFVKTLIHLIQLSPISLNITDLCFQVIDFISAEYIVYDVNSETVKKLEESACYKIEQYLIVEPRSCTTVETKKLLAYFVHCPTVVEILMYFVFIDIQRAVMANKTILATEISEPWNLLRKELMSLMEAEKFTQVLYIVKGSSLLQLWLEKEEIHVKLYDNDLNVILRILMLNLNSESCRNEEIIFQILMSIMAHNESNKVLLQSILALPFTQDFKGSMDISQKMVQRAKSLNVETMSKCLETLCTYGNGKERLKLLRMCILNSNIQIAVTAVLHSVLLLKDANIKLEDICQYVLNTALSSTKVEIHEALANILGQITCVSSGKGKIINGSLNKKWSIYCECCTKNRKKDDDSNVHYLPEVYDHIFDIYFKLFSSTNISVRLHISKNILSFSNHIKSFNSNEITKKWLPYIYDENTEIRSNLASVIGQLLSNKIIMLKSNGECLSDIMPNDLDEYVDLIIDVIANTLITALNISNHSLHDTLLNTAKNFVCNYINFSYNMATTVHRVAKCIGYEGSRQLLYKDGHYAVCFLITIIVEMPKANALLYDIAELIRMDIKQMLQEYFPYICSHAFLDTSLRISTETLKLVTRITETSLAVLTKQSFMGIFEELMLHFYKSPEKIIGFLEIISEYDTNQRGKFGTHEQVVSYLNLRLHGILVNFDIKLGPKSDEYTQQSVLASLVVLIQYMGAAYLTPLRYKILGTLRTSLGFKRPGFSHLVCDAWDAFIHNIAIEDLGPLFPTICVSLIPLQKIYPEKVNSMLEFLIVQNNESHNSHISELFFIDDMKVPTHITNIVKAHILQARPEGFNANLKLWLKRITHETDEVRIRALKHLQTFLEEHRSELNKMILSETDVHPLIVELLDTLLIGCQDKDESIRLCYGECLGELGAIEPSLLPRRIISREDSNFISDMNEEFACALLSEHVRAFQMQKNSQSMDCFSLAIQEILKAYDISPQGRNSKLWKNLSATTQQIIIPFLTSHYKIATVTYIIANNGEEEHLKLREEMLAVINVRQKSVLDLELLRHRPLRYEQSEKTDEKRISEETRRTRCSQVVFCILDHLQRWLRERRLFQDDRYEAVKSLLDSLVVAEGCYQSREYHRALMYLEQHMASSHKGLSELTEGGLLAKIYAQLDEPDGVSGILATQNQSPTLQQLVLAHEVNGQLQDAATCYERLAQKEDLKHTYLQGMIQCYLGLDQPFTAKHITEGLLSTRLHILNEFDKATSMMLNNVEGLSLILEEWEKRGQLLKASRGVEFVLSMRRATLDLAVQLQQKTQNTENLMLKQEIGKIWLKSAKIARKAGLQQQAYMHILSASDSCPPQSLYIEQAQLYWQKGCQEDAFTTLNRCFLNCFKPAHYYKQLPSDDCSEERRHCAKAKLLFAKYNDETLNVDTDSCINNYKEAIEVWKKWEKSWVACAEYYDTIVGRMSEDDKDRNKRDLQIHMMNFYGKSLQYGCKYIHHSMPKMLTIWLDNASRATITSDPPDIVKFRQDRLLKMTQIMEVYHHRLPTFMWLTAFSQLVSRICHPSPQVQNTLCAILVKLISAYPQHCLWMMASVFNSSYPARQKRCQEILNHTQLRTPDMSKLIKDFHKLWERLIELSNKTIPDGTLNTTVTHLSKSLPRLLASKDFSPIMMPTTKFRQLHLPAKNASLEDHNPFLLRWVHITKIEENVVIMASLQRPRRIALRGSDGKEYLFMCKPKDDLRKDFRLMEFNDIVNKYLQNDPESRQRRLYIRTYSVVPLNEECGLIEWIPNLVGLRPTIMNLYVERGIAPTNKEIKAMICALKDPLEKKKKIFLEKQLPRHPPVFGDWFRITFPDSYGWYEARTAYIRTTAVMSMVGYILGLGDRHGENILFDSKCGDCVHVDFNCLFNRGELFDWPERVPFRLTHNMVDAMGPLKIEGPFRRACQITMRVLRQESSTLLSVLTPFVYDPLVSWNKNQTSEKTAEKTNEKAVEHIKNIEQRLKGLVRYPGRKAENIALHLSVEGQTNHLILEATNIDNLCQMYFGWGAYL
ncbi:hypothetical protein P5V15_007574 [Pogonomyrmex californicus]